MDIEANVKDDYDRLSEERESVRETIASVSDISSANHPTTYRSPAITGLP